MKVKYLKLKTYALVLAMIAQIFLFSCCGAPQKNGESGMPPSNSAVSESPDPSSPSPSPFQSLSPTPSPSESVSKIPPAWEDNGIFSGYYENAYELLEKMTLDEKIGQMLLLHCPQKDAAVIIEKYQPGGIVLFEIDFKGKTLDGVVGMIETFQNAAALPMMTATDEEGGSVVRISRNQNLSDHVFASPQRIFSKGGLAAIREDALEKAALFKKLGLNLNLAPVADVSISPGDYMYARSFGQPAAETAEYIAAVITAMQEQNLSAALKHFPGYGSNSDSHKGIVVDNRPYSTFTESDFIPFVMGIESGAESILVSHNIVQCMDNDNPASLSPEVHAILRNKLGFTGIIMTDELSMQAIKDYAGSSEPAVLAVLAGNDMLMLQDCEGAVISISAAVKSGDVPAELIDHAVFRILAWKMSRGIISQTFE